MAVSGVIAEHDKYSELFLRIARAAGVLIPVVAATYSVAVMTGFASASPLYNFHALIIVVIGFMILGITQYIVKPNRPVSLGIFVALYHLFGMLYLVVGPGFTSPIAFCWIVLTLITEIFYGRVAMMLSLMVISGTCLTLSLFEPVPSSIHHIEYTLSLLIIVVSSVLVGLLRSVQRVEHQDLKRSRSQELFQRGQLTTLINSLNAAILSTSSNGTVRVYNAALLGLIDTNQSLSGKNIDDVFHLYDSKGTPVSLIDISAKAKRTIDRDDLVHRFDDGEEIRLSISCAPIRSHFTREAKHHEGFIVIVRDITQSKSREEERDEFISVVSHELRTPITITEGTLSNLQLLLELKKDPKALAPALKDAHEQVVYLASMVNDLATLSRAERGASDAPEQIDVRKLLEELYHRYAGKAADKGLALNIDASHKLGTVFASRLYLEEILQNFITNAIKYTLEGTVTLEAHRLTHGIEFSVHDTGIGISKSDQKRIFEKFYRAGDYRTRETSGTGLGLYVVKKLAGKLGIDIKFESRLNHGSTFSFVLHETTPQSVVDIGLLTKQG